MTHSDGQKPPFFWLHIKKCGGGTIRRMLQPHYVLAERTARPVNFIQSPPAAWNDILNNFRVPLGAYQFRRALFARTYLYPQTWEAMPRIAFLRPPVERAVSAFHYLALPRGGERSFVQHLRETRTDIPTEDGPLFDAFLDLVQEARRSENIYRPVNLHFTTHTAPVTADVTDEAGTLLLSHLFRLEALEPVVAGMFESLGLPPPDNRPQRVNQADAATRYTPSPAQRRRIEQLYPGDCELFDRARTRYEPPLPAPTEVRYA
ncbi:sulfotransferase family 2 domain-containing protein [Roseivivax sediminis]|uniref:Sulfotransferase family protein n=1 Tax=Roseivivax sediminis TaxID=936889 RepID=A0A1I2ABK1_9RHOB|nr:sulfotransferase family 2 domain-containing protein [Roseivivax sediminis]SFE41385.1 Sulfotransferase family protein [Roseivivax sediminis]